LSYYATEKEIIALHAQSTHDQPSRAGKMGSKLRILIMLQLCTAMIFFRTQQLLLIVLLVLVMVLLVLVMVLLLDLEIRIATKTLERNNV